MFDGLVWSRMSVFALASGGESCFESLPIDSKLVWGAYFARVSSWARQQGTRAGIACQQHKCTHIRTRIHLYAHTYVHEYICMHTHTYTNTFVYRLRQVQSLPRFEAGTALAPPMAG